MEWQQPSSSYYEYEIVCKKERIVYSAEPLCWTSAIANAPDSRQDVGKAVFGRRGA